MQQIRYFEKVSTSSHRQAGGEGAAGVVGRRTVQGAAEVGMADEVLGRVVPRCRNARCTGHSCTLRSSRETRAIRTASSRPGVAWRFSDVNCQALLKTRRPCPPSATVSAVVAVFCVELREVQRRTVRLRPGEPAVTSPHAT